MKYLLSVFILIVLVTPQEIFAQGLVSCEGPECNICHVLTMISSLKDWLFGVAVLIAVILIAYAGFLLVFSRGDVSAASKGKQTLTNAVIGIIIMLAAWTIVDTFMKVFLGGDFGIWNKPEQCGGAYDAGKAKEGIELNTQNVIAVVPEGSIDAVEGAEGAYVGDMTSSPSSGCPTCVSLSSIGVTCKNSSSCTINQDYAERLAGLLRVQPDRMTVTEAFPPTRKHKATCHSNGKCVDIVFSDRKFTSQRVQSFINRAKALGFRAVYEPAKGGSCLGASSCIQNVATGNHFSLYER